MFDLKCRKEKDWEKFSLNTESENLQKSIVSKDFVVSENALGFR